jgi:hypothetical protein
MRVPFVAALRSLVAECRYRTRTGQWCLLCDLPMICLSCLAYLCSTWLRHRLPSSATFLDQSNSTCQCPHCLHNREHRPAA